MKRLLRWRRLRWFVLGGAVRFILRRTAARSVDRASADIEARLPSPVRKVLDAVPADAVRAGGSAVVAGRTAKRVALNTHRATKATTERSRQLSEQLARVRSIRSEIGREAETKRRELKADYLRATEGNGSADDIMLDLRDRQGSFDRPMIDSDHDDFGADELPEVDPPARRGRWRAERRLPAGMVARVQRTYRPLTMPWDR